MTTLILATRNPHKVGEIRAILGEGFRYQTLSDFPGLPEVIEDAGTFAGNATKKALELARAVKVNAVRSETRSGEDLGKGDGNEAVGPVFVLADDSGLEVDALDGAPGVHSARFASLDTGAAGNSSAAENNAKLLRLLGGVPAARRTARFRCVIALAPVRDSGAATGLAVGGADKGERDVALFEGVCEGRITEAARGQGGFGYDPLFMPEGYTRTFGELEEQVKNRLSHRARALSALRAAFEA